MPWIAVALMGIVLGLLGGGGGILTVPILTSLFGLPAVEATGASLFVVGCTSLAGALPSLKRRDIDVRQVLGLAAASLVGSFLSRRFIVPAIPDAVGAVSKGQLLMGAFAILMVVVGVRMLLPSPPSSGEKQEARRLDLRVIAIGFVIGIISGGLGAGGGFLILPTLTLLMGLEMKKAVAASLLVIAIQSLAGFSAELGRPIRWDILLPVLAVSLAGMAIGTALRPRVNDQILKRVFAFLVLAVAVFEGSQVAMNRF